MVITIISHVNAHRYSLTSIPKWMLLLAVKGFLASGDEGGMLPNFLKNPQVHGPQGVFSFSQVVCAIWYMIPSSPLTNTLSTPLKSLCPIGCATGDELNFGENNPPSFSHFPSKLVSPVCQVWRTRLSWKTPNTSMRPRKVLTAAWASNFR